MFNPEWAQQPAPLWHKTTTETLKISAQTAGKLGHTSDTTWKSLYSYPIISNSSFDGYQLWEAGCHISSLTGSLTSCSSCSSCSLQLAIYFKHDFSLYCFLFVHGELFCFLCIAFSSLEFYTFSGLTLWTTDLVSCRLTLICFSKFPINNFFINTCQCILKLLIP